LSVQEEHSALQAILDTDNGQEQRDEPTILLVVIFFLSFRQLQWPDACNNSSSTGRHFASSDPLALFAALLFLDS
jgi:hypothetical protein